MTLRKVALKETAGILRCENGESGRPKKTACLDQITSAKISHPIQRDVISLRQADGDLISRTHLSTSCHYTHHT